MKVAVVNSIWCKAIDNEARREITRLLKYKKVWFKQGKYSKIKHSRLASFIDGRSGIFLAGFLSRIEKKFPDMEIEGLITCDPYAFVPDIAKINFRKDQLKAIKKAVSHQRGVIQFATASGKTVIAGGIISCFDEHKALFLAHSKDIISQTYERFKEYGFNCGLMSEGKWVSSSNGNQVLCATYQSYFKRIDEFKPDIVIVDECHHVNSLSSQYGKILKKLDAFVRIGLTGTLPNTREGKLALEGLIGPVIAKLTIKEGVDKKIISLPKITLLPVKNIKRIAEFRKYHELRDKAIVNNRSRNRLISRAIIRRVNKNKSCLIIVNEVKHGEILLNDIYKMGYTAKFLQGKTPSQARNKAKQNLINKKELAVITTNIWNEGVDIPTLDVVILAFGGKANTRTIQAIGRGLRRVKGKKRVEIIDFLDPYRYLAEHVVARLNIYKKEKLL